MKDQIKDQIFKLVKEYYDLEHKSKSYSKGDPVQFQDEFMMKKT